MDAIIGRYKVCMEESGLVLKHPTGISFNFLPDETLELLKFINLYRKSLDEVQHEPEYQFKEIDTEAVHDHNKRWKGRESK